MSMTYMRLDGDEHCCWERETGTSISCVTLDGTVNGSTSGEGEIQFRIRFVSGPTQAGTVFVSVFRTAGMSGSEPAQDDSLRQFSTSPQHAQPSLDSMLCDINIRIRTSNVQLTRSFETCLIVLVCYDRANSKTAALAYTGFKGAKSADEGQHIRNSRTVRYSEETAYSNVFMLFVRCGCCCLASFIFFQSPASNWDVIGMSPGKKA
jgi:hypothetical protein